MKLQTRSFVARKPETIDITAFFKKFCIATRTISSVHNRFELWTLAFLFSAQPNIAVGYMRYMGPAIIYYIAKWLLPAGYFGG